MRYEKTFSNIPDDLFSKIKGALVEKGFQIVREGDNSLFAERGSSFAQIYSFDARKYKTKLEVKFDTSSNTLTFIYTIRTGLAIRTPDDQQTLDQELNEIITPSLGRDGRVRVPHLQTSVTWKNVIVLLPLAIVYVALYFVLGIVAMVFCMILQICPKL